MTAETTKTAAVPVTAAIIEDALRHRLTARDGRVHGFADAADDVMSILANRDPQGGEAWRPIETAPKDGTRFWGKVGDDARSMLWHEGFDAFVTDWRLMEMAPGYLIDGHPHKEHSPNVQQPEAWMPLPASPQDDRMGAANEARRAAILREVRAYAGRDDVGSSHWLNALTSRLMVVTR